MLGTIFILLIFALLIRLIIYLFEIISFKLLERKVLKYLNIPDWNAIEYIDDEVTVKSVQALNNYDAVRYFKDDSDRLNYAKSKIDTKYQLKNKLTDFLNENPFQNEWKYKWLIEVVNTRIRFASDYRIRVNRVSRSGNNLGFKDIVLTQHDILKFIENPMLLMSKSEQNKHLKEINKLELERKQKIYFNELDQMIDLANNAKNNLVIKDSARQIDLIVDNLLGSTINHIKKIKNKDSEEWDLLKKIINNSKTDLERIINNNQRILSYYESSEFGDLKNRCETLMNSQREFNEYINDKVASIANHFGQTVIRNESVTTDNRNYIRPYKKTISPFNVEVSKAVYSSAENNPLAYVVKKFYPNKELYPEQIDKLYKLIEELETLKDAKKIVDANKREFYQYFTEVPEYVLAEDEAGFYSRLGFANIQDSDLVINYQFTYTSPGGYAQKSFTIPMTEETIGQLINILEAKITAKAFVKEQRRLMTGKLRERIKSRDNYTCCSCGNSVYDEPNLLLEIDHIIPVSKGGYTREDNLQTLCWKCNRSKSNKLLN